MTWSVRGVTRETRSALEQAAARAGKTLGQYLNEDVSRLVAQQLQPEPTTPVAELQKQVTYLRQLVENLANLLAAQSELPKNDPPTHA